jgi:two-component system, OmpR family, copper resistance phosphate regulon response regulator CusR
MVVPGLRIKNLNDGGGRVKILVDDLALDTDGRDVFRAGCEIKLTSKEFALLEYLMRNAGTVVTRTMISEHVWGIDFDTLTNAIDVYINYLRNKVDKGFKKKLVHTVRGRGYILKSRDGGDGHD